MNNPFPIVAETKILVKKENELSAQILRNLQMIYYQKIHLEMGYSGIYVFCVEELGMSEGTAQRRCDALKISEFVPELPEKIEKGEISLAKIAHVAIFVRQELKETGRVFGKKEIKKLVEEVQTKSTDCEVRKHLMAQSEQVHAPIPDQVKVVTGGRTVVQFEVDDEWLRLLEQIKDLESHQGQRSLREVTRNVFKEHLQRKHPAFKKVPKRDIIVQSQLSLVQPPRGGDRSRYIPHGTRREVWIKDKSCCSFLDPVTGKRCGSTFRLQIEHLQPFSMGGTHEPENLSLRCQGHNLFAAEKMGLLHPRKVVGKEVAAHVIHPN